MPRVPRTTDQSRPLAFIPPLKPTLTAKPPEGDQWLHEVKHDGYRTELIIGRSGTRAFTMNGHDWTSRYPTLVAVAARLRCRSAILDGEAVVQREDGIADFHALRAALSAEPHRVICFAFDLLHLNGEDLRRLPLAARRAKLEHSQAWLKTKCMVENDFVVVGVEPNPRRPSFALLAREEGGQLVYAGSAFVTLPSKARDQFWERAEALKVDRPAVAEIRRRKVGFVKPTIRVRAPSPWRDHFAPREPDQALLLIRVFV